jgi:hypothetical protein
MAPNGASTRRQYACIVNTRKHEPFKELKELLAEGWTFVKEINGSDELVVIVEREEHDPLVLLN